MKKINVGKKILSENEKYAFENILFFAEQKKLFLVEICFFQKDLSYFTQNCGLHTIKKQKDVSFGI